MTTSQGTSALDELRAQLAKERSSWDPNPGDMVVGTVVELRTVDGKHSQFPLLTLDTGDELVDVPCGRSVLRNEVLERNIDVGDAVGIKYEGTKNSLTGSTYHAYSVSLRKGTSTPAATTSRVAQDGQPGVAPELEEDPF